MQEKYQSMSADKMREIEEMKQHVELDRQHNESRKKRRAAIAAKKRNEKRKRRRR